ncbi:MAG: hemolysin III family protein [Betaproteobacteria bacterium]
MVEPALLSIPGFSDPFSSLSHLGAAFAFACLGVPLLRRGWGSAGRVLSLFVFVFSCVLLLSMSGVFHLLAPSGPGRWVLQRLDHAAIFLLIAGSFTPVHAILFTGPWRWGVLVAVWTIAITALTVKTVFFAALPEWAGLLMYLGFGWLGLVSGVALLRRFGYRFVQPVLWSALAYTVGAIVDFLRWPTPLPGIVGAHELFHVAVLAGIGCHWVFISRIASGRIPGGLPVSHVDPLPVHVFDDVVPAADEASRVAALTLDPDSARCVQRDPSSAA